MSVHEHFAQETAQAATLPHATARRMPSFRLLEFPSARQHVCEVWAETDSRSRLQRSAKRCADIVLASTLLILFAPALTLIAFAIRLDSSGPSLFRQQRLGFGGKAFRILKFRTMHVLEDGDAVRQAVPDDVRITRVGRFLRASSLDELPQLLNVLKGEMSLVGPRPHAVAHDRHYGALIGGYTLRQRVKPGITGWAQVNGLRGATPTLESMRRRVEYDVWYAARASFLLDLTILFRTLWAILRRSGAH